MSVLPTQSSQIQTRGLTTLFLQVAQSNQALDSAQQRSALAAQQSMDQVVGTIQALTRENGALKAKMALIEATNAQQQANFGQQLTAMQQVIQQQGQMIQDLTSRTTSLQVQIDKVLNCAGACKCYILVIYGSLWPSTKPTIPHPS